MNNFVLNKIICKPISGKANAGSSNSAERFKVLYFYMELRMLSLKTTVISNSSLYWP